MAVITLTRLADDDREQFILDNQCAFKYGATEEFGMRDNHLEEDGEIISRKTIGNSIDAGMAYRIREDGRIVGGLVLDIDKETRHNKLELLFVNPEAHSKGIGYKAWQEVERLYPETRVWETCTPYFETRNIHFYVNKCGFHMVEFFNSHHPEPAALDEPEPDKDSCDAPMGDHDGMLRFVKQMNCREKEMRKTSKRLKILAVFTFFLAPLFSWGSVLSTDETAVFASLSRMIWYSGSALQIFIAMLVLFIPMLIAFFLAHSLSRLTKVQKQACRICMIVSCVVLYIGAMWVIPSDGKTLTPENIWHAVLCFGGMLMIFLTYCLYTVFVWRNDKDGAGLLAAFLIFAFITGAFTVLNVFDDKSYVIASAVSELYVLSMMSVIGFLTYYLAYRNTKAH